MNSHSKHTINSNSYDLLLVGVLAQVAEVRIHGADLLWHNTNHKY